MALNQILHDEQIAMMQHASATACSDIEKHRSEIGRIRGKLSLFPYPHRPYLAPRRPSTSVDAAAGITACLSAHEGAI